jgi:hypothetical protein
MLAESCSRGLARPPWKLTTAPQRRSAARQLERRAAAEAVADGCELASIDARLLLQRRERRPRALPPAIDVAAQVVHQPLGLRYLRGEGALAIEVGDQHDIALAAEPAGAVLGRFAHAARIGKQHHARPLRCMGVTGHQPAFAGQRAVGVVQPGFRIQVLMTVIGGSRRPAV